jgi:hypothetical protein
MDAKISSHSISRSVALQKENPIVLFKFESNPKRLYMHVTLLYSMTKKKK